MNAQEAYKKLTTRRGKIIKDKFLQPNFKDVLHAIIEKTRLSLSNDIFMFHKISKRVNHRKIIPYLRDNLSRLGYQNVTIKCETCRYGDKNLFVKLRIPDISKFKSIVRFIIVCIRYRRTMNDRRTKLDYIVETPKDMLHAKSVLKSQKFTIGKQLREAIHDIPYVIEEAFQMICLDIEKYCLDETKWSQSSITVKLYHENIHGYKEFCRSIHALYRRTVDFWKQKYHTLLLRKLRQLGYSCEFYNPNVGYPVVIIKMPPRPRLKGLVKFIIVCIRYREESGTGFIQAKKRFRSLCDGAC